MIWGRKRGEDVEEPSADEVDFLDTDAVAEALESAESDAEIDWRADGPFDIDEVDLEGDEVLRLDLGALIITPWPGAAINLQVNQATQRVQAVAVEWAPETAPGQAPTPSAFEVVLYAAPRSGGLAEEFIDVLVDEAAARGGTAEQGTGPFGPELHRVLPVTAPDGSEGYHVSRTWFAEGPRWMLRGTLMGYAALPDAEASLAKPFVEFFRNIIVRRGDLPLAAGVVIESTLPEMV